MGLLPEGSKYVLVIDFSSLQNNSLEQQTYWVYAMNFAHRAGAGRRVQMLNHSTVRRASRRENVVQTTAPRKTHEISSGFMSQCANRVSSYRQQYTVLGAAATVEAECGVRALFPLSGLNRAPTPQRRLSVPSTITAHRDNCCYVPD